MKNFFGKKDKSYNKVIAKVDEPSLVTSSSLSENNNNNNAVVYEGKSVVIYPGKRLTIPIQITTSSVPPGSIISVEYEFDIQAYDLGFAIMKDYSKGGYGVVKAASLVMAKEGPITNKVVIDATPDNNNNNNSVPCLINFMFDNEYSWIRKKVINYYKITVITTPATTNNNSIVIPTNDAC